MHNSSFEQELGDLTATLGDPTRRGIFISVRESPEPLTAAQIAELFDIHPNVARHHLDRLTTEGYLRGSRQRRSGRRGPRAGRPAKSYEATDKRINLSYPANRHDLLAELLVRVVERLAPDDAPRVAEQVGKEYGLQLAAEIGLPEEEGFEQASMAVAKAMMGVGFGMNTEPREGLLLTHHCPFGQTAADHPDVVCKLDQGIVKGLMQAVHGKARPVAVTPHQRPEDDCVTEV
ncbi:MAG: helix-turn-helix transcriptional regulator [Acidimicrobiia bacterium]